MLLHINNTMVILLKTASVRVSFIQIMQVRVLNKGKSVWKSRYVGDVSSEPLCQAVDASEGLPPAAKVHNVRGWEVDVGPCAAVPTAPHVQPQRMQRV